jgi:nicotinate-nucleotide adenylyltransferase
MRVAIYGGSFNPPHIGHGMVASWLLWTGRVEAVWFLPSFSHPFAKDLAPFAHRVAMCEAMAGAVGAEVCTLESTLPTPSYTIDVLRALSAKYPEHQFQLVAGADVIDELPRWKAWSEIAAEFAPILVGRQGYPCPPGAIEFPPISSTEIRARLVAGEPVDHLVAAVVRPLLEYYKSGPNPMKP